MVTPDDITVYAKELSRKSLLFFGVYYFSKLIPKTPPSVHVELCENLQSDHGDFLGFIPRGGGKSVWTTTITPLWEKLCHDVPFQVGYSQTDTQAVKLFRDLIEPVLDSESYSLLHSDFSKELSVERQNDHEIVFADGCAILFSSRGASTRGLKHNGNRPWRIFFDDLENDESVATLLQRDKTWDWINRSVRPMLDPEHGRLIWVGTLLHEDACMTRAEKSGAFTVMKRSSILKDADRQDLWEEWERVWDTATLASENGRDAARAFYEQHQEEMDNGADVLWQERFPYEFLRAKKREVGSFAFATEYQNHPAASENQIITDSDVVNFHGAVVTERGQPETWLIDDIGMRVRLQDITLVITVDPAISEKTTADYFVVMVVGAHANGTRWVLDMKRDRLPIAGQVQAVLEMYGSWKARANVTTIGIETVAYQKALKQLLDAAGRSVGISLPTRELKPGTHDKIMRLSRWQPSFERKEIRIQKTVHASLLEEITGFTRDGKLRPSHDDTVDALTYALDLLEGLVAHGKPQGGFWWR